MDRSYTRVNTDPLSAEAVKTEKILWKYFIRQIFVSCGIWNAFFMIGLTVGSITVIVAQLKREANSTNTVSDEMTSWLSSVSLFISLPLIPVVCFATAYFGRKRPFLIANLCSFASFIHFYYSTTVLQVLVSLSSLGILVSCQNTISLIVITECVDPKYRGVFLCIKYSSIAWGMWCSNTIGTFFHWKYIFALATLCSAFNVVCIFFWPESPYWLASKGKYDECTKSFRWLHGSNENCDQELERLITDNKARRQIIKPGVVQRLQKFSSTVVKREFYKGFLLFLLCVLFLILSGKPICAIYAIEVLKRISQNESAAYRDMLILDGVTVLAMYAGSILAGFFNRRTLLFLFSSICIVSLFVLSLYLYLIHLGIIFENVYISITLLIVYSISATCGPGVIGYALMSEMAPLRYTNFSMFFLAMFFQLAFATLLKISPFLFTTLNMYGCFLFFGISETLCTFLLYLYLPETKDRTMKEIEDCLKGNSAAGSGQK